MLFAAIFLGGGLGSVTRYGVSQLSSPNFPFGTLMANVLACLIMGLTIYSLSDKIEANSFLRAFVVIGFCGGFSTFSTFSYETFELFKNGNIGVAVFNILINITFCLLVFYLFKNSLFTSE